jgi:hypothetical protein
VPVVPPFLYARNPFCFASFWLGHQHHCYYVNSSDVIDLVLEPWQTSDEPRVE